MVRRRLQQGMSNMADTGQRMLVQEALQQIRRRGMQPTAGDQPVDQTAPAMAGQEMRGVLDQLAPPSGGGGGMPGGQLSGMLMALLSQVLAPQAEAEGVPTITTEEEWRLP